MVMLEQLAQAAIDRNSLQLRSLAQDWLDENTLMSETPRPSTDDTRVLATAASLIELFAQRRQQNPPLWVEEVGLLPEPLFLLESAENMKRLRELCETQSPEPLRKRRLYAPPNFLEFA